MKSAPLRALLRIALLGAGAAAVAALLFSALDSRGPLPLSEPPSDGGIDRAVAALDGALRDAWNRAGVEPTPPADPPTLARRLSLALTGAPPSLEELRRLEALAPAADPVAAWLGHLLADRRSADYLAERFARAFLGTEPGPFLVFRRRRLLTWLADGFQQNRPYDAVVRDLVAAEGLWTTRPETNFVTVSVVQGGEEKDPDEARLAARVSRAFLGLSLDCVECHDDPFGDRWKQADFHQLAAFFGQSEMTLTGLRDQPGKEYETRYLGQEEAETVPPRPPFSPELMPGEGRPRERLARWITHPENAAFARATVNRVWALLFGRPLVEPVDDLPPEGPYPSPMELLADEFAASGYDLHRLVAVIARSEAFRRSSRSPDPSSPVDAAQEAAWAAFPITPLRPEQVAGGVIQAASLRPLDRSAHILDQLRRYGETADFVRRFGDRTGDEFAAEGATIPQRLLLMNGKLVRERTEPNLLMNASTRLAALSPDDESAVRGAFLAALARHPGEEELGHFARLLAGTKGQERQRALADLYWSLLNSTEFSWNR